MGRFRNTFCCCLKSEGRKISSNISRASVAIEVEPTLISPASGSNGALKMDRVNVPSPRICGTAPNLAVAAVPGHTGACALLTAGGVDITAAPATSMDTATVLPNASSDADEHRAQHNTIDTVGISIPADVSEDGPVGSGVSTEIGGILVEDVTNDDTDGTATAVPATTAHGAAAPIPADDVDRIRESADNLIETQMMGILRERLQGPPSDAFIAKLGDALDYECSQGAYNQLCLLVYQAETENDAKIRAQAEAVAVAISDLSYVRACKAADLPQPVVGAAEAMAVDAAEAMAAGPAGDTDTEKKSNISLDEEQPEEVATSNVADATVTSAAAPACVVGEPVKKDEGTEEAVRPAIIIDVSEERKIQPASPVIDRNDASAAQMSIPFTTPDNTIDDGKNTLRGSADLPQKTKAISSQSEEAANADFLSEAIMTAIAEVGGAIVEDVTDAEDASRSE